MTLFATGSADWIALFALHTALGLAGLVVRLIPRRPRP